jgi:hypothetical protein
MSTLIIEQDCVNFYAVALYCVPAGESIWQHIRADSNGAWIVKIKQNVEMDECRIVVQDRFQPELVCFVVN